MKNIVTIYFWQKYNKINGSLFYAYEYAAMLNKISNNNQFIIAYSNISEDDIILIDNAFKNKYKDVMNYNLINRIKLYSFINKNKIERLLYLDVYSYFETKKLTGIKNKNVFIYVNNDYPNKEYLKCNTYGYYDYQTFKNKVPLKLGTCFFKNIKSTNEDFIFLSGLFYGRDNLYKYPDIYREICSKYDNLLIKEHGKIYDDLFSKINQIIYLHTTLDTNNRILIESAFYNIKIKCYHLIDIQDSIQDRYNNIQDGNLDKYLLTEDDILIQNILND